jgi:hypothetical protein
MKRSTVSCQGTSGVGHAQRSLMAIFQVLWFGPGYGRLPVLRCPHCGSVESSIMRNRRHDCVGWFLHRFETCVPCAHNKRITIGEDMENAATGYSMCVPQAVLPRPAVGLQMAHTALSNMMGRAQRPPFSVAPQFQDQRSMVATSGPRCTMIQNSKLTAFVNFMAEHSLPESHVYGKPRDVRAPRARRLR